MRALHIKFGQLMNRNRPAHNISMSANPVRGVQPDDRASVSRIMTTATRDAIIVHHSCTKDTNRQTHLRQKRGTRGSRNTSMTLQRPCNAPRTNRHVIATARYTKIQHSAVVMHSSARRGHHANQGPAPSHGRNRIKQHWLHTSGANSVTTAPIAMNASVRRGDENH